MDFSMELELIFKKKYEENPKHIILFNYSDYFK
jgi:hypothetical protein